MNREEILDLAMDILDNTDATLEEAMGIALETQVSANKISKDEARKQALAAYRGKRDPITTITKDRDGRKAYGGIAHGVAGYARQRKAGDETRWENHGRVYSGRGNSTLYSGITHGKFTSNADLMANPGESGYYSRLRYKTRSGKDLGTTNTRIDKSGRTHVTGTSQGAKLTAGLLDGVYSDSKEAAIMDTALDYMDMYDVSMETALDMAYEDYED